MDQNMADVLKWNLRYNKHNVFPTELKSEGLRKLKVIKFIYSFPSGLIPSTSFIPAPGEWTAF